MTGQRHVATVQQCAALHRSAVAGPAVGEHALLTMQRLAGNAAIGSVLGAPGRGQAAPHPGERNGPMSMQRQLKVVGDQKDVAAMAAMLDAASGLILVWDAKKKTISVKGPNGKKALSQEVADRLQQIIADTGKDAEIHLGRTQEGVHIGAFPVDFKTNPVQELRIDQILLLEKGAPGFGVSSLMHEIIENYEMHSYRNESFNDAFEASHEPAVKEENKILDQIQDARGESRSGDRLNQYTVDVDLIPGTAPKARGRNKPPSTGKVLFIEAHQNEYLISAGNINTKTPPTVRRVPSVPDGVFRITGFTTGSQDVLARRSDGRRRWGRFASPAPPEPWPPTASMVGPVNKCTRAHSGRRPTGG